jgi:hypothetical protein
VVAGGSVAGSTLSCSAGSWEGDQAAAFLFRAPQSFAYQWSVGGTDIAGANAGTYTASTAGDHRCRVSASNATGTTSQTSAPHTVAALPLPLVRATISLLRATRTVFAVGRLSTPLSARTTVVRRRPPPRGTVFSFRLDLAATVRIAIRKTATGRRVGRLCLPNTRARRTRPRCLRTITVATLTRTARPGLNRVAFSGRIRGRALAPGRYRAVLTARNSAGTSAPRSLGFRIVRP